jgi:RNA polymerase sigma-70 factor (ECF subfamily)
MDGSEPDRAGRSAERFERLYEEHSERVAAYLLARVDRDAAADAIAATFEVAWRRITEVPAQELPWLLGVARRVLANARRSRARQAALVDRMPRRRGRLPAPRRMPAPPRSWRARSRN